jgi:hypothetical protein
MRLDWTVLPTDGTPEHPTEVRFARCGEGDDGARVRGYALVAEVEEDLRGVLGGAAFYDVDAMPIEGDQALELHTGVVYVASLDEACEAAERLLAEHDARQAATIRPG